MVLEINKHFEGYVDSYFGPTTLKKEMDNSPPKEIAVLRDEVESLGDLLGEQGKMREYLKKCLESMKTTLQIICGEEIGFYDEIKGIFDVKPRLMSFKEISKMQETLQDILPKYLNDNRSLYQLYRECAAIPSG